MTLRSYFHLLDDRGEIPALDGLRGIAILLVVVYHCVDSFVRSGVALLPLGGIDLAYPFRSGWMGVNLFFVLSGFLITHHLLRRRRSAEGGINVRHYLAKRFLRIVPTFYVVLAIAAAGLVPHYEFDRRLIGLQVAWHAVFLQDYFPSSIVGPFWSLGVEEKFYLVMPVVLLAAWRLPALRARLGFLAAIAAIPLLVRIGGWLAGAAPDAAALPSDWKNPFHLNLDALFLGAIAAWVRLERDAFPRLDDRAARRLLAGGAALVAARTLAPAIVGSRFFYLVPLFPLTAIGMFAILFGAALLPRGGSRLLESRWLARAGRIAYPWYLTHILVLHWSWAELTSRAPRLEALDPTRQFLLFLPVYAAASIAAALVLHFLVEKPCLLLKDSIGRGRRIPDSRLEARVA